MKKKTLLSVCLLFFVSQNIFFPVSEQEFRLLPPDKKVSSFLDEFEGKEVFIISFAFAIKSEILAETYKETLPFLLEVLSENDIKPHTLEGKRFEIIQAVLFNDFYDLLNTDDRNLLINIYEKKYGTI